MSNTVRFGYLVPTRDAVMRAPDGHADIQRVIDLAVLSEGMGYDSIWIGDSILARPRFEALTTLAAIAARTSRAQIGTAIYLTPLRHPLPLAHTVGNLDLISGGRLLFGIGLGTPNLPVKLEYAACGVDSRKRGLILEENLQIMKRLWTGEEVTFQGKVFDIKNVRLHPLPGRDGGPPVLMAAAADAALKRLARFADGWLPICPNSKSYLEDWQKICHYCSQFGRDPATLLRVHYVTVNVDRDEAKAAREMEEFLASYYGMHHQAIAKHQAHCAGSPERCAAFLRGYVEAGVPHFVVRFAATFQEPQMERFLADVAPALS